MALIILGNLVMIKMEHCGRLCTTIEVEGSRSVADVEGSGAVL